MKKFVVLFFLILLTINSFSQVDKIKDESDKNKKESEKPFGGTGDKGGGGNSGSPCIESCGETCLSGITAFCFDLAISGMIDLHKSYLEEKDEIPLVTSFDFIPQFGYHPPSSLIAMPRIRGNWGLFSTDARFTSLIEITSNGTDFYNTIDWQILQLNVLVTKPVVLRIGSGLMYEIYSKKTFSEHSLGLDIFLDDFKYRINNEFRITPDYNTGNIPRIEGSTTFNYAVLQSDNIDAYVLLGVLYQNYYLYVPVWSCLGGMAFNFH
jgi:hypothetical protein